MGTEDDAKALAKTIVGHKDAIQEFQEQLSNTDDRIAVVQKSIAELDDSVTWATEIRRNQHAEFVTLTANNAAATELLKLAVNRLNKFYAPKLHKAAPRAELSSDDRELRICVGKPLCFPQGEGRLDERHSSLQRGCAPHPRSCRVEQPCRGEEPSGRLRWSYRGLQR